MWTKIVVLYTVCYSSSWVDFHFFSFMDLLQNFSSIIQWDNVVFVACFGSRRKQGKRKEYPHFFCVLFLLFIVQFLFFFGGSLKLLYYPLPWKAQKGGDIHGCSRTSRFQKGVVYFIDPFLIPSGKEINERNTLNVGSSAQFSSLSL